MDKSCGKRKKPPVINVGGLVDFCIKGSYGGVLLEFVFYLNLGLILIISA